MPVKRTIRGTQGDTWADFVFRWLDSEREPIAIASARMTFRGSPEELIELDGNDGLDLDTPGEITPLLTPAQTDALTSGEWDVEATATSGRVKTLFEGNYIFDRGASRD